MAESLKNHAILIAWLAERISVESKPGTNTIGIKLLSL